VSEHRSLEARVLGTLPRYRRQRAFLLSDAVYDLTIQKNYDILPAIRRGDKAMPGNDITLRRLLEKTNPICRARLGTASSALTSLENLKKRTQIIVTIYVTAS
jgi:hypothetical protein